MPIRHLKVEDARRLPWKNGLGVSLELARADLPGETRDDEFLWRISTSTVPVDQPFSGYAGVDRWIVVTGGQGLVLDHGKEAPAGRVAPFVPYRFSGEWPTTAHVVVGGVPDFNVLTRRGRVSAEVEVTRLRAKQHRAPSPARTCFLHLVSGEVSVHTEAPGTFAILRPGDSLLVEEDARMTPLRLDGVAAENVMIEVRFDSGARARP